MDFLSYSFMVFLALASMTFMGAAFLVDAANEAIENAKRDGSGELTLFGIAFEFVEDGLIAINKFIATNLGIDVGALLSEFTQWALPGSYFQAFYTIFIAVSLFLLFLFLLIYLVHLLKPLSGQKASLKIGMFLLAIIGYSIPILNLFPWFVPWALVVWRHPN